LGADNQHRFPCPEGGGTVEIFENGTCRAILDGRPRFDSAEFWNPKVRGAECLNRQAARSILPIADLRMRMVMAGHSKAEIVAALKAAFDNKQLPDLENGNMVFMMSKSAYLYDAGDHNGPHLMFFTAL